MFQTDSFSRASFSVASFKSAQQDSARSGYWRLFYYNLQEQSLEKDKKREQEQREKAPEVTVEVAPPKHIKKRQRKTSPQPERTTTSERPARYIPQVHLAGEARHRIMEEVWTITKELRQLRGNLFIVPNSKAIIFNKPSDNDEEEELITLLLLAA